MIKKIIFSFVLVMSVASISNMQAAQVSERQQLLRKHKRAMEQFAMDGMHMLSDPKNAEDYQNLLQRHHNDMESLLAQIQALPQEKLVHEHVLASGDAIPNIHVARNQILRKGILHTRCPEGCWQWVPEDYKSKIEHLRNVHQFFNIPSTTKNSVS